MMVLSATAQTSRTLVRTLIISAEQDWKECDCSSSFDRVAYPLQSHRFSCSWGIHGDVTVISRMNNYHLPSSILYYWRVKEWWKVEMGDTRNKEEEREEGTGRRERESDSPELRRMIPSVLVLFYLLRPVCVCHLIPFLPYREQLHHHHHRHHHRILRCWATFHPLLLPSSSHLVSHCVSQWVDDGRHCMRRISSVLFVLCWSSIALIPAHDSKQCNAVQCDTTRQDTQCIINAHFDSHCPIFKSSGTGQIERQSFQPPHIRPFHIFLFHLFAFQLLIKQTHSSFSTTMRDSCYRTHVRSTCWDWDARAS